MLLLIILNTNGVQYYKTTEIDYSTFMTKGLYQSKVLTPQIFFTKISLYSDEGRVFRSRIRTATQDLVDIVKFGSRVWKRICLTVKRQGL